MVVVAVLGMHRSGTSCLMRMLQQAGLYVGPELMNAAASSNLEGHAEALEAVRINDRILELSGGSWDRLPAELRSDEETTSRICRFLEGLRGHPVAGWKDPRTTITFPLWKPHLPAFRLAACLRHPVRAARSLQVRDGWPLERGLSLWEEYNERLLAHVAGEPNLFWFDFDLPERELRQAVQGFCRQLGLPPNPAVAETFNPFLRHHTAALGLASPRLQALYHELRERARTCTLALPPADRIEQCSPGLPSPSAPKPAPESPTETGPAWEVRLGQLARVQQLHNEIQQQQTRWQDEIRHHQVHLEHEVQRQQGHWEAVWRQCRVFQEAQQQQLTSLESVRSQQAEIGQQLKAHRQEWAGVVPHLTRLLERLTAELGDLRAAQQEHGARLVECQSFVAQIRGNAVFRLRRLLWGRLRAWASRLRKQFGRSGPTAVPERAGAAPLTGQPARAA
jgi:hypothetical protein